MSEGFIRFMWWYVSTDVKFSTVVLRIEKGNNIHNIMIYDIYYIYITHLGDFRFCVFSGLTIRCSCSKVAETTSDSPHQRRCGREAAPTSKYAGGRWGPENQRVYTGRGFDLQAYYFQKWEARNSKENLLVGYRDQVASGCEHLLYTVLQSGTLLTDLIGWKQAVEAHVTK